MPIYDEEPEEDFWLLYNFTGGDGTKYEQAKENKYKIILSYVDCKMKEYQENKK